MRAVLLLIFLTVALPVLTAVLGHFYEESSHHYLRGPGVRRSKPWGSENQH